MVAYKKTKIGKTGMEIDGSDTLGAKAASKHQPELLADNFAGALAKIPRPPTVFHAPKRRDLQPSGQWSKIQEHPHSGSLEASYCKTHSPREVADMALRFLSSRPNAHAHLRWYLEKNGADFLEDMNLERMLMNDGGIRRLLSDNIPFRPVGAEGTFRGHVAITHANYQKSDFLDTFGNIERLDFEVNYATGEVHVWFADYYEWHPVYPGIYPPSPTDRWHSPNCVFAAMVELQADGARNFLMIGRATVKLMHLR
jgi:hypothetical protein